MRAPNHPLGPVTRALTCSAHLSGASAVRRLCLLALLLPATCFGLSDDQNQPIQLEADSVEINEASGVSIYQGNVIITQGSLKVWADKMWIHRRAGQTEKIITEGTPTRFRQLMDESGKEVRGKALRAEFYLNRNEVILIEDAVLEQEKDEFRSDRIIYDRSRFQVRAGTSAQGKQRVHVTIEPAPADQ